MYAAFVIQKYLRLLLHIKKKSKNHVILDMKLPFQRRSSNENDFTVLFFFIGTLWLRK